MTTPVFLSLMFLLGVILYLNILDGGFIWDDNSIIKNNLFIREWRYFTKNFTGEVCNQNIVKSLFFRPVQMFSYMVDYSFWGLKVQGYHLTNILLHILVAYLIFWLVVTLYSDKLLAYLTSLFFLIHPVHTEAVSYLSGRAESLVALGLLLAFISYLKYLDTKKGRYILLLGLSFSLALLSKEHALMFPFLLLFYHYTFKRKIELTALFVLFSLALGYIILRFTFFRELSLGITYADSSLGQRLPGALIAFFNYLKILFFPLDLHMVYGVKLFNFWQGRVLLGGVLLGALFIYLLKDCRQRGVGFFAVGWFLISLMPLSNVYPLNAYMAEHWLYFPSLGFFILISRAMTLLYRREKYRLVGVVIFITLLLLYSYLTIKQNQYWQDPFKFYQRTLKYAPDNAVVNNNLANLYVGRGEYKFAVEVYKRAIQLDPNFLEAYRNLANIYCKTGQFTKGIDYYQKILDRKPDEVIVLYNLATAYLKQRKYKLAQEFYEKTLNLAPNYEQAAVNLANLYYLEERYPEAIALYLKALRLTARDHRVYYNLAGVYEAQGNSEKALEMYECYLELKPKDKKVQQKIEVIKKSLSAR